MNKFNNYLSFLKVDNEQNVIYEYDSEPDTSKDLYNTFNKFYTLMSCKFANWTHFELFKFITRFPLSQKFNIEIHDSFLKENVDRVEELKVIAENVRRFINILQYFRSISKSYYDTSLLKTLLLLQFKIHFLMSFQNSINFTNLEEVNTSDDVIIYIIFEIINSIQNFSRLNCLQKLDQMINYTNIMKQNYDDQTINSIQIGLNIDKFFEIIKQFNLEPVTHCYAEKYLLENIVANSSKDVNLSEISDALVSWKKKTVSIKDMFNRVQESFDLELILWYQKSIFKTIIKLICYKILIILESILIVNYLIFPDDIIDTFDKINTQILPEIKQNVSTDCIGCFTRFAIKQSYVTGELENCFYVIRDYYKTITDIVIITEANNTSELNESYINHKCSLFQKFINYIILYSVSLKCFNNLYKFLHSEYDQKYYIPFQNNPMKIDNIVNNDYTVSSVKRYQSNLVNGFKKFNDQCDCINNLRNLCVEEQIYFKILVNKKNAEGKFLSIIQHNLMLIKEWSILKIEQYTINNDRDILEVAYSLYIILNCDHHFNQYNIEKLLFTVMTYLNSYAIEHCEPTTINYLMFGYIDFAYHKDFKISKEQLKSFIRKLKSSHTDKPKNSNIKLLDVLYFYNEHVNNKVIFTAYEKVFKFYWKGRKKNIKQIFDSIKWTILSPSHVYAFYDVYFKFIIIALYIELTIIFDDLKLKYENEEKNHKDFQKYDSFRSLFNTCLMENNYPPYFSGLLNEIKLLLKYVFNEFYDNLLDLIDYKLQNLNIKKTGLFKNTNEKDLKQFKVKITIEDIVSKVKKIEIKIENQSNDLGIFIDIPENKLSDVSHSRMKRFKHLVLNSKNYIFHKQEKNDEELFSIKELCDSMKSVNEMITDYIIKI